MPRTYHPGNERHWEGFSGQGYCKIALYGGLSTITYSDDELLEHVLWAVGQCFPPGNEKRVSEALIGLGHDGTWRLQFNVRMGTEAELQVSVRKRSQRSFIGHGDNGIDIIEQ